MFASRPDKQKIRRAVKSFPSLMYNPLVEFSTILLSGAFTMATAPASHKLTTAEKMVILEALDVYAKGFERAERAAKDPKIAEANKSVGAGVRSLIARIESHDLEV